MEISSIEGDRYSRQTGAGIGAHGQTTLLEVHEATDRNPLTPEEIRAWRDAHSSPMWRDREPPTHRLIATGRLKIVLPPRWHERRHPDGSWQRTWSDGSRAPLEAKLDSVLRSLQARAEDDVLLAKEHAEAESGAAGRRLNAWSASSDFALSVPVPKGSLPKLIGGGVPGTFVITWRRSANGFRAWPAMTESG